MKRLFEVQCVAVCAVFFAVLFGNGKVSAQIPESEQFGQNRTAESVAKACDLFPLSKGRFVRYDVYATDTAGATISTTRSSAVTGVISGHEMFKGIADVTVVDDTTNSNGPTKLTISGLHYHVDGLGDIQAYADENFIGLFAPSGISSSLTPPDSFVNYLSLSHGDRPYHVLTFKQPVTVQSFTLDVALEVTGRFTGVERVTVPAGTFDSAYHFVLHGNVKGLSSGSLLMELNTAQDIWLVRGIGIVKSTMPSTSRGPIQITGSERQMVSYGEPKPAAAVGFSERVSATNFYPNPARSIAKLALSATIANRENTKITVYNSAGIAMSTTGMIEAVGFVTIDASSLPNGVYFVGIRVSGRAPQLYRLSVVH